jgi:type IV secretory pathway VirB6-like protein
MQQSYFSFVFQAINDLLNQNASQFQTMGLRIFYSMAAVMISWFGVQSALSSAGGGGGFNWAKFTSLLQELLICYIMLAFYTTPIPGFGVSFTHLILDQVQSMTASLNLASVQDIIDTLNMLEASLPSPSSWEILLIVYFWVLELTIIFAQASTLFVVMFGYVATAVIMLLGPVFIPFKIVPQMEWMFWGWFRSFIQFAFYQLIAAAYVFVFAQFLKQIVGPKIAPMSGSDLAYLFVPLLLTLITFILGVFKIPALTFSIFSGRAGDYVRLRLN